MGTSNNLNGYRVPMDTMVYFAGCATFYIGLIIIWYIVTELMG